MMRAEPYELTLIIPAFNEAEIITRNIAELRAWQAKTLPGCSTEILVVDDGSRDGMGDLVETYAASHPGVRVVRHPYNRGRGRAIRTGFENSNSKYVICLDADLSYSPDHILALLDPLRKGEADITLASAYHPQGSVSNVPWSRAVMSRWGNRILSSGVYGRFHTVTCVVRGYTRAAIDQLELVNDGKDLHLEIIQKATLFGLRMKEVPAHLVWRDRKRHAAKKKRVIDHIPFLSMSGTIASHLVYNYVLRPGSMLLLPIVGLLGIAFIGGLLLLINWVRALVAIAPNFTIDSVYVTMRETLLQGSLTLQLVLGSLLISTMFLAFYFASQQNKKNFEEMYILLNRMNRRLKQLEGEKDS